VLQVLIAGGGVAGLALAGRLVRDGIGVEIVEKSAAWDRGTGIYLPGNAMRALTDLGVADHVIGTGRVNKRRRYLTANGRTLLEIDVDRCWRGIAPWPKERRWRWRTLWSSLGCWQLASIRERLGINSRDVDDRGSSGSEHTPSARLVCSTFRTRCATSLLPSLAADSGEEASPSFEILIRPGVRRADTAPDAGVYARRRPGFPLFRTPVGTPSRPSQATVLLTSFETGAARSLNPPRSRRIPVTAKTRWSAEMRCSSPRRSHD
jgi:FAD binding domain